MDEDINKIYEVYRFMDNNFPEEAYQETERAIRFSWLRKVRYVAVFCYAVLIALAYFYLKIETNYILLSFFIVFLLINNAYFSFLSTRLNKSLFESTAENLFLGISLLFDISLVSALLFLTGGHANPFSTMLLLYVFLTAIVLDERWTWASFIISSLSFASLFWWYHPVAAFSAHSHHQHHGHSSFSLHLYGMLISFALLGALFSYFFSKLHKEKSRMENQLFMLREKDREDRRLIGLANLCAGAAHEMNTPLATLRLIADDLKTKLSSKNEYEEDINDLQAELERLNLVLKKMRAGVEVEGEAPVVFELDRFIEELEKEVSHLGEIEVINTERTPLKIHCFQEALRSSILILLKNAFASYPNKEGDSKAFSKKEKVLLSVSKEGNTLTWEIKDWGTGMSSECLERLGEPFFTTKEAGNGMGLGIYIAKSFCRLVGGKLDFSSKEGKGTEARLVMPLSVK